MPRVFRIEFLESRTLLATFTVQGAPLQIDITNNDIAPGVLAPIGPGGNFGFFDIKQVNQRTGLYFEGLDSSGAVTVPQTQLSIGNVTPDSFGQITAARDTQGDDILAFTSFPNLYFVKVSPAGQVIQPATALTQESTMTSAGSPVIAVNPTDDSFAVTYLQNPGSASVQGFAVVVNPSGSVIGSPFALTPAQAGSGGGNLLSNGTMRYDPVQGRFVVLLKEQVVDANFSPLANNVVGQQFTSAGPTFAGPVTLFSDPNPNHVVNGPVFDGNSGFLVTQGTFNNNGGGSFTYTGTNLVDVPIGDFNGDGVPNVLLQQPAPGQVGVVTAFPLQNSVGGGTGTDIVYLNGTYTGGNPSFLPSSLVNLVQTAGNTGVFTTLDTSSVPFTNTEDPLFPPFEDPFFTGSPFPGLFLQPVTNVTANTRTFFVQPFVVNAPVIAPPVTITPGTVTATQGHPVELTAASGTLFIGSIKGVGSLSITTDKSGHVTFKTKKTNKKSIISILKKIKSSLSGRFSAVSFTADSPFASLSAPDVDFTGNLALKGVDALTVGSVADNHQIALGPVTNAVVKFDHLATTNLTAVGSIKSLTATDWTGGSISATSIASLLTTGNFDADITVTTLGKLAVGAALGGTGSSDVRTIRAKQSIGAVSAASIAHEYIYAGVKPTIKTLPAARGVFNNPEASITSVTTRGFTDAIAAAPIIMKINITGLVSANATPFGITAERITNYKRDAVIAKNIFSKKKIDTLDQYTASTV